MFSKACEYGIRATIYIAQKSLDGKRVRVGEIAQQVGSPVAFTAKILHQLARCEIVESAKGPRGGFAIAQGLLPELKLSSIVNAIDGDAVYHGCGLGLDECNEAHPCPLHHRFKIIREDLRQMLETTSIYELATGLEEGVTNLKSLTFEG